MASYSEIKERVKKYGVEEESESNTYAKIKESVKNNGLSFSEMGVDGAYVDSFMSDAEKFLSSAQDRYNNVKYSTALGAYYDVDADYNDLFERYNNVRTWLNANKSGFTEDEYKKFSDALDYINDSSLTVYNTFKDAKDYYGQWESQKDYEAALKYNEEQKKYREFDTADADNKITSYKELSELLRNAENAKNQYDLMQSVNGREPAPWADKNSQVAYDISKYNENLEWLGKLYEMANGESTDDIDELISTYEKNLKKVKRQFSSLGIDNLDEYERYNNQAKKVQKFDGLVNNAKGAEDFQYYAQVGGNIQNPEFGKAKLDDGAWLDNLINGREDINNIVTFSRANKEKLQGMVDSNNTYAVANKYLKYAYMTDEEAAIYNYYLGKGDTGSAGEYLAMLNDTLMQRKGQERADIIGDSKALALLFSVEAGIDQTFSGLKNLDNYFKGTEADATTDTQYASGIIRDNLEGGWGVAYDALSTTSAMLPSILVSAVPVVGQPLALATLGGSAIGNSYAEMRNLGYSAEQAQSYATLVGASEMALQSILGGISKLGGKFSVNAAFQKLVGKIDNALARVSLSLVGSTISEGVEEGLQTWLEPYFKAWTTGEDFEGAEWDEILYSGLLGMLSAGLIEGAPTILGTAGSTISANRGAKKVFGDGSGLVADSLELGGDVGSLAKKYQQKRLDKGKELTGSQINRLVGKYDTQKMKSATEARLTALGEKGDVGKLADVLVKQAQGESLTRAEQEILDASKYASRVANELDPENIQSGEYSTAWSEKIGTKRTNVAAYNKEIYDLAMEVAKGREEAENASVTKTLSEKESSIEGKYDVSKNGNTVYTKDGKSESVSVKKVVSVEGGLKVELEDGRTVSASDLSLSAGDAIVYEMITKMNVSPETANVFLNAFKPTSVKQGAMYFSNVSLAYQYGKIGNEAGLKKINLPKPQKQLAYERGRKDAASEVKTEPKAKVDGKASTEGTESKKSGIVYENGFTYDESKASEIQKVSMAHIEVIDKLSNLEVHVFESKVENGKRVAYVNGKLVEAPNGYFTDGNKIYIDFHAGDGGEGAMLYTVSHEITHYIREWNKAGFKELADFLIAEYGKRGVPVNTLIEEQKEKIKDRYAEEQKELPSETELFDMAYEEMVADAMSDMLADPKAYEKLMKLKQKNRGLWAKVGEAIKAILDKFKSALGIYKTADVPVAVEAFEVRNFSPEVYEKLQDLYLKAFVEADANFEAAQRDGTVEKYIRNRDITFNLRATKSHKAKLAEQYSKDASIDLETLSQRYDKIISIWESLGGELDSKFLTEWNNKVGKDRAFTVFKAQAGYKYNVELSSMCKKGVPLFEAIDTIVKEEVMKELNTKVLGKAEKEILYDLLKEHNFEIPCAICYVEQARQREGVIIDAFLNGKVEKNGSGKITQFKLGWNDVLKSVEKEMKALGVDYTFTAVDRSIATDKYVPADISMDEATQDAFYKALKKVANKEIARYNKAEGKNRKLVTNVTPSAIKEVFKGTLPSNLKIFKVLFTDPSSRFTLESDLLYSSTTTHNLATAHNDLYSLFNSQGGVAGYKTKQGTVVYWGDILGKSWKPSTVRDEGGIRNQSNSDFQMYTLLDQAQMYIDFSAKGYYLQAYTKVLSELKLFGLSRGKINASLIPAVHVYHNADGSVDIERTRANAGLDKNGELLFDDIEGINHKEAFMLIEDAEYSKSIGGICIGYSDAHILKLLDDSRVQQIIGFHDKTDDPDKRYRGARYAENYNGRNEAVNNKDGKTVHIGFNPYVRKAEKMFSYNAKTETYEGEIEYKGKTYVADDIPKLATALYLEMCEAKNYTPAYEKFASHENYYKLLADFSLYDSQGHYAPHRKVSYNMPDSVPYLDINGKKQYMPTKDYIKAELEKELKVRDSISEALADKSENGLIPQFVKSVNESKQEHSELKLSGRNTRIADTQAKIAPNMTDAERYEILKKRSINNIPLSKAIPATILQKMPEISSWDDINKYFGKDKRNLIQKISKEFGVFDKEYFNEDIELAFEFSGNNLRESYNKQKHNYIEFAKMFSCFDSIIESAVGIEIHNRMDYKPDPTLDNVFVLMSAYRDGGYIIPVKLEVKKFKDKQNTLYVAISLEKIKMTEVWKQGDTEIGVTQDSRSVNISIAKIFAKINPSDKSFLKYIPDGFLNSEQKAAKQEALTENGSEITYSLRGKGGVSNRTILAKALEDTVQNDIERNKLAQYKKKIALIESEQAKLAEIREKANALRFTKGRTPAETKTMRALDFEANQIENRISTYDKQLLNLESTKALKNVLEREKKMLRKRLDQKGKEALKAQKQKDAETIREIMTRNTESRKKAIEGRNKTALKRKLRNVIGELNHLFSHGTKERNVKQGMQPTVATSLALGEVLFSDEISNADIVRHGVDSVTENESKLLNEYRDALDQIEAIEGEISVLRQTLSGEEMIQKVSERENLIGRLKNKISRLNGQLSDVFVRERVRLNKITVSTLIEKLASDYASLETSEDDYIKNAYMEETHKTLVKLQQDLGGTIVKDMSLSQLEAVYKAFKMVKHMVSTANNLFYEGRTEDLMKKVSAVQEEILKLAKEDKRDPIAAVDDGVNKVKGFLWNEMKPATAFEKLGSETFMNLFWDAVNADGEFGKMVHEAGAYLDEQRAKYHYADWNLSKAREFKLADGKVFKLTLGDMMSIYAYSKREQADKHMTEGGFVFDENNRYTGKLFNGKTILGKFSVKRKHARLTDTYRVDYTILGEIQRLMEKEYAEAKAYTDAMQEYFRVMGEKGNKISNILFGIDLFTETNYIPLQSSKDYLNSNKEALSNAETQVTLKNMGVTKATTPGAKNPIVLRAFDDLWLEHIDKMSKYCAYVLPIENIQRVFNNVSQVNGESPMATKALIASVFGNEAKAYFDQYIKDLNGGANGVGYKSPFMSMFAKFKKTAVGAKISVMVQQPLAIIRAMAMIRPDYFVPFLHGIAKTKGVQVYEEIKQYAPVAIIKEMGGFDIGSSNQVKNYIGTTKYRGVKGKVKGLVKDSTYRKQSFDDTMMLGATKADELGWSIIWLAVKKEVESKQKLTPGSKEFLEACGKRFTEVVVHTQVYDSVNSRSGMMRSKSDLVKFATSFMGEPTTIVNMMYLSVLRLARAIKSGNKAEIAKSVGRFSRTSGVVVASIIATSLAKSAAYANYDDEEDESWTERWMRNFGDSLSSDLNPLTMLPFFRDIVSIYEGWDVERPDMSLIADVITSAKRLLEDGATKEEVLDLCGDIANALGIPAKNIVRDVKGIINLIGDHFDSIDTVDAGEAFKRGWSGEELSKSEKLYQAIINGDEERLKVYRAKYDTEEQYESAVKKALRENDSRIKEAAEARYDGNIAEYKRIAKEIIAEGHFSQDIVVGAINAELSAIKKGESSDTGTDTEDGVSSIYKVSDANAAFERGDTTMALEVIEDLINTKVANGKTEKEAKASIKSSMTSYWKPLYIQAYQSRNSAEMERIRRILYASGLYGNGNEVVKTCQNWLKD